MVMLLLATASATTDHMERCWMRERSKGWWERVLQK